MEPKGSEALQYYCSLGVQDPRSTQYLWSSGLYTNLVSWGSIGCPSLIRVYQNYCGCMEMLWEIYYVRIGFRSDALGDLVVIEPVVLIWHLQSPRADPN